jgi:hypothetical protein
LVFFAAGSHSCHVITSLVNFDQLINTCHVITPLVNFDQLTNNLFTLWSNLTD